MGGFLTGDFSFHNAAIRSNRHIYFALADDDDVKNEVPGSVLTSWENGNFPGAIDVDWNCVGMAVVDQPEPRLVAVGEYGQVTVAGGGTQADEAIPIPSKRGPLRHANLIAGNVYAVGMGRYVYRRAKPNSWIDMSPPSVPKSSKKPIGFEAVDGFNENEIYAVGWNGEIWTFDGQGWRSETTPTNAILVATCCGADGIVYACGQRGLLLRGRRGRWEVIQQDVVLDDIWGLCWYRDALYLSTMRAVFRLDGEQPDEVHFGPDTAHTCFRLVAGHGVMCSVGAKDTMLYDGSNWTRID